MQQAVTLVETNLPTCPAKTPTATTLIRKPMAEAMAIGTFITRGLAFAHIMKGGHARQDNAITPAVSINKHVFFSYSGSI